MSVVKHLRKSLGLTTQQIADYCQIPLSVISMAESGRRELPRLAHQKLSRLLTLLQIVQDNQKGEDLPKPVTTTIVNEAVNNTGWQLKKLQQKLQQMQHKYKQATTILALRQLMQEQSTEDRLEHLLLEVLEADAEVKLAANNVEQQALLQIEIRVLQYKMELLAVL